MDTDNKDMEQPRVVTSHDIHIDTKYADGIDVVYEKMVSILY